MPEVQPPVGFFTDTSVCIGCKACQVACKEWNLLEAAETRLSGLSYDNTLTLSANEWRHVKFIELFEEIAAPAVAAQAHGQRWTTSTSSSCWTSQRSGSG